MEDIKMFAPEDKFLNVGKKRFKIWISAERSLKATALFNKISQKGTEERKSIITDMDFYVAMLDVAFLLIRQDFRLTNCIDWLKRQLLSKNYILKHMDINELKEFIDNALEPIIGTKKKELEREQKTTEAMLMILDNISPEALAELLQNSLQGVDTKKVM
jgi:hypothetical protein